MVANTENGEVAIPDSAGVWLYVPTNQEVDVYHLDPVGGILCLWGPDVGITYSGSKDTQQIWDTDEWQGHIPVHRYDNIMGDDNAAGWLFAHAVVLIAGLVAIFSF